MTTAQLVDRIMVKLEEFTPFQQNVMIAAPQATGFEVKPIRSYIEDTLDDSCNEVLKILPIGMINPDPLNITNQDTANSRFILGDDFLRIHTLKMNEWEKSINIAFIEGSPTHELQKCEWTKGGKCKPVAIYGRIIDTTTTPPSYHKYIQYFSVDTDHTYNIATQVTMFDKTLYTATDMPQSHLSEFFALNAAKKVYEYYGMNDKAALVQGQFDKLLAEYSL